MSNREPESTLVPLADDAGGDPALSSLFASARVDRPAIDLEALARIADAPRPMPRRWPLRIAIAGVVVLGLAIAWHATSSPAPTPAPLEVASPIASTPRAIEIAPIAPEVAPEIAPTPAPRPRATPRPAAETPDEVIREGTILLRARRALAAGDASAALDAVHTHEHEFPHGTLEGEREVLAIQALAAHGEDETARARARRFLARFPTSPYRDQVERVLGAASIP